MTPQEKGKLALHTRTHHTHARARARTHNTNTHTVHVHDHAPIVHKTSHAPPTALLACPSAAGLTEVELLTLRKVEFYQQVDAEMDLKEKVQSCGAQACGSA